MARSAEADRRIYAHSLDAGIVAGVITIILHLVLAANDIENLPLVYVGLFLCGLGLAVGTYFLKRRKDAP